MVTSKVVVEGIDAKSSECLMVQLRWPLALASLTLGDAVLKDLDCASGCSLALDGPLPLPLAGLGLRPFPAFVFRLAFIH